MAHERGEAQGDTIIEQATAPQAKAAETERQVSDAYRDQPVVVGKHIRPQADVAAQQQAASAPEQMPENPAHGSADADSPVGAEELVQGVSVAGSGTASGPVAVSAGAEEAVVDAQGMHRNRTRNALNAVLRTVLLMLLACALGAGGGFVLGMRRPAVQMPLELNGKTSVDESELDSPLGTYHYNGETTTVTVRDAIEESSSLEAAKNSDGTYQVPSVDTVLGVARNAILLSDAQERGIAASDEDAAAYALDTLGTQDFSIIAVNYNMDVEQAKARMRDAATLRLLRDAVVQTQVPAEPDEPAAPENGKENEPSKEYADYVLALVGDEWDAGANTWASEDGPFRERLRDFTISNDKATYSAAQEAYTEALEQIAVANQQVSGEWTAYVNERLSHVTVELATLVA